MGLFPPSMSAALPRCSGHGTMSGKWRVDRRTLLLGASLLLLGGPALATPAAAPVRRVEPVPARFVALAPSPFADAFAANRASLLSLDPERLLHDFYGSAGLPAPKPVDNGWNAQGIARHSLGHRLSACALMIANTGDRAGAARLDRADAAPAAPVVPS